MIASLAEIARHVIWYTDPDRVLADVNLFLAQVMARGSTDDIVTVQQRYSADDFRKAYRAAPPGLFTRRAWAYWGIMLFNKRDHPMPERFPGANRFDWRNAP